MSTVPSIAKAAPEANLDPRALIEQLHLVRRASLSEVDWHRYCHLMRQLCRASHCAVVLKVEAGTSLQLLGVASDQPDWSPLHAMPPGVDLLAKAQAGAYAQATAQTPDGQSWLVLVLALHGLDEAFLILNIRPQERAQFNELTLRALLATDFGHATHEISAAPVSDDVSDMLGLAAQVMQQQSFESACLTLVNGISAEWALAHASLGWIDDGRAQTVAISHLDRFERNSRQTELIEAAMHTALNQGHEIWWSAEHGDAPDSQELGDFARDANLGHAVAIPVRDAHGQTHAVLLLGFSVNAEAEPPPDLNALLLSLELIEPRLRDLRLRSLSLALRAKQQFRGLSERVFGPEHAVLKAVTAIVVLALLYVLLGTWNYRVEANAQLNTESTRLISAQFDGRVDQVYATAGDLVKAGSLLVALDTRELEQQQSELNAEVAKTETEVNKNRADGRLADTEIAQARLDQSLAKAQRVEAYLKSAKSVAPFEGVIVEGERKDLLGAPVKKGDKILKIAKIEGLYVTLMVAERQMRYVQPGASGEVSLLSHADHSIPVRINSVIPVAQVKGQEGNQFMITAELLEPPQPWWRPGMTGLARIDVGQRSIAWILTHRMLDNLRLLLWW